MYHCYKCKTLCQKHQGEWKAQCKCGIRCSPKRNPPPKPLSDKLTRAFSIGDSEPEPEPASIPTDNWLSMTKSKRTRAKATRTTEKKGAPAKATRTTEKKGTPVKKYLSPEPEPEPEPAKLNKRKSKKHKRRRNKSKKKKKQTKKKSKK